MGVRNQSASNATGSPVKNSMLRSNAIIGSDDKKGSKRFVPREIAGVEQKLLRNE